MVERTVLEHENEYVFDWTGHYKDFKN
jgi:hypothetical protein